MEPSATVSSMPSFLQAVLDALPDVFYVFDADGRYLLWNARMEQLGGYTGEEIAEMSPASFFLPADHPALTAAIAECLEVGQVEFNAAFVAKDGTRRPYRFTGRRVVIDDRVCVVGVGTDHTDLERAVEGQRARDDLLRAVVDRSPIAMAIVAADQTVEYVNPRAVATFGYEPSEIPTMTQWWLRAHPDPAYRAEVMTRWNTALERAIHAHVDMERGEYSVTCKDGTVKTTLMFGAIVRDKAFVLFEDITERKQAEAEALQERENNLSAMAENANDGILIVSPDGAIRYANRRSALLTGYSVDELVAGNLGSLTPADEPRWLDVEASSAEARLMTASGAVLPLELSTASTVWNREPAFLIVLRDVSDRKRAELERHKLQAQLAQAQKMESLGTLAGGIAHDFNNLLASIRANIELARMDVDALSPAMESLDAIDAASTRAAQLVKQILTFSRQQPANRTVIAVGGIVDEVGRLLRATLPAGIQIVLREQPNVPKVFVDSTQLHQVFMNLGTNAWQAIQHPIGTIVFATDTVQVDDDAFGVSLRPGRYVRVRVSDDGAGMDLATQSRIFDPFFTTKGVGQGTGLGLAVVLGVVQDNDGAISVQSRPDQGTTFSIFLPAVSASTDAPEPEAPTTGQGAGRILILDDEHALTRASTRLLERLGYKVTAFTNPSDALTAVRAAPDRFDVVITDENMPGMGGLQVARAIGVMRRDLPVILMSGNSAHSARELSDSNVSFYLEKPFTSDALRAALDALFKGW